MTTTTAISNNQDIIDSRDVIERINWLEAVPPDNTQEDNDELAILQKLAEQAEGYASDWTYGEALIRDSYFEEYAQDLAEDIGAIQDNAQWPYSYIDWKRAAQELQADYTSVDFDGVTYWIR